MAEPVTMHSTLGWLKDRRCKFWLQLCSSVTAVSQGIMDSREFQGEKIEMNLSTTHPLRRNTETQEQHTIACTANTNIQSHTHTHTHTHKNSTQSTCTVKDGRGGECRQQTKRKWHWKESGPN